MGPGVRGWDSPPDQPIPVATTTFILQSQRLSYNAGAFCALGEKHVAIDFAGLRWFNDFTVVGAVGVTRVQRG